MKHILLLLIVLWLGNNSVIPEKSVEAQKTTSPTPKPDPTVASISKGYKQADENVRVLLDLQRQTLKEKAALEKEVLELKNKLSKIEKVLHDRPVIIKEVPKVNFVSIGDSTIEVESVDSSVTIIQTKPLLGIKIFRKKQNKKD